MTQKTTEAQKRAAAKFTKISAQLNEHDMLMLEARLIELKTNKNAYIKSLIVNDIDNSKKSLKSKIWSCWQNLLK